MSERRALGILQKLMHIAQWCQDETLRRDRGYLEIRVTPEGVLAEIVIKSGQKYTKQVTLSNQLLIEGNTEHILYILADAYNEAEKAAR